MSDPDKKKLRKKRKKAQRRAIADELDKRGRHAKENKKKRKKG